MAVPAVGMFSLFKAILQDGLNCRDGFREATDILDHAGEQALKERFVDLQRAINVLKHGRGHSYDALVAKAAALSFRVKLPDETFFEEGDVAEVSTLIAVEDAFVLNCAHPRCFRGSKARPARGLSIAPRRCSDRKAAWADSAML